jgi:acetoin utilization deacetylase AcuC-like enzyme
MKNNFVVYYNPKQVLTDNIEKSKSKSPLKPKLVVEELQRIMGDKVKIKDDFEPYDYEDFLHAHTVQHVNYVYDFNQPGALLDSDIPWSKNLVESLEYTNACLYNAIKHSINNTNDLVLAPVAGFHHAQPNNGLGFCTFSGQVIASIKIYRETKKRGCYLDLDGHFGNSIEDTRKFNYMVNKAIPQGYNFNPNGKYSIQRTGQEYVDYVKEFLYEDLTLAFTANQIDYVVWCHGADSHEDDDYPGQVNTLQWLECSKIFFEWVKFMKTTHNIEVPVTLCLFGGYRHDDYQSVISLHCAEMVMGYNYLVNPITGYDDDSQPMDRNGNIREGIHYEVNYKPHPRRLSDNPANKYL